MVVAGYGECEIKLKGLVKCDYYYHPAPIFISLAVYKGLYEGEPDAINRLLLFFKDANLF